MKHTFTNFSAKRYEWAFNAKKEFINRFVRLDVKDVDSSPNKELTISVYGPTQVGKTTVILSLLGLKQERLRQLSLWLRGQRKLGESSTVTVMRYERSLDNYFNIRLPNGGSKTQMTGEQLEIALQSLRSTVETQGKFSVEPVVIEIPSDYFETSEITINIIDLPGVESAELKEVEHVKQCIKHWLPLSEVCLLVDDATQLTAFTQYTLKEIKFWFEQLENFRIIPTRALSLDSVRKSINNNSINTADELVRDYSEVLSRVLKRDLDLSKTVYPIDVGNSWEFLQQKEPYLYATMKDIMKEIMDNLQKDLRSLDVNKLSFNHLTRLYKEAERESKLELEKSKKHIEKIERLIEGKNYQLQEKLNISEKMFCQDSNEINIYNEFLESIEAKINYVRNNKKAKAETLVENMIKYDLKNKKASILNMNSSKLQFEVDAYIERQLIELKENARNLKIKSAFHLETPQLYWTAKIDNKIDSFLLKKSYENALNSIRNQTKDWIIEMYEAYICLLSPVYNETKRYIKQLSQKAQIQKLVNDEEIKNFQKTIDHYTAEYDEELTHLEEIYEMWKQDCEHAQQLQSYFIKHWLLYKKELDHYFLYGNKEERWLAVQYLQLLQQDGKQIIESLNLNI